MGKFMKMKIMSKSSPIILKKRVGTTYRELVFNKKYL
jgi:hypothetical protein